MQIRKITIGNPNTPTPYSIVVNGNYKVGKETMIVARIQKYGRHCFRVWVIPATGGEFPAIEFENQTIKVEYDLFPEKS